MTSINGTGSSITQILAQNSQTSKTNQSSSDSASEVSSFSLSSQQASTSSTDAMGEMTSQSESITSQLSESIMSMLIELQETSAINDGNSSFDAQQLFSDMDTDDDGTLTKDEFMAAAPDDATEQMSENLWNVMSGSDAESISEDDYLTAMIPPSDASSTSDESTDSTSGQSEDSTFDPLDTNEDGIVSLAEMMAAAPTDNTPSASSLPDASSDISDETETASHSDTAELASSGGLDPRNESFNNHLMAQVMS